MAGLRPAEEMKDSGIAWLGEFPASWRLKKIKYVSELNPPLLTTYDDTALVGYVPMESVKSGYMQPFENYKSALSTGLTAFQENDIIMAKVTPCFENGNIAIARGLAQKVGFGSSELFVFRANGEINKSYLFYYLQNSGFKNACLSTMTGTGGLKRVSSLFVKNAYITYPTKDEQQAIAAYLDERCAKIDELIAEAAASIAEYKELKQAVIFEAVTKGLDKNVPLKDSGVEWIGLIPSSWALVRIPRILDYRDAYPLGDGDHGMIKTEDYQNEGIPYIRVQNLGWGTDLLLDNVVYISEENNEKIKSSQLKPNDVLFCKTGGTIGKTGMVPESLPVSNTTSHVGKITVNPAYNARYVFYVLSSNVGYRQFWEIACQKTTRPELSIAETKQIRLTWPSSRKEQDNIVDFLDRIVPDYDSLISEKQSLIDDLKAYKKSLIYEVVTGKRRVV